MKIILCGACGKMGRAVTELSLERGEEIVYGVDVAPAPMPYPVGALEKAPAADVLIDFSSHEGVEKRLAWCAERKLPALLAATGYSKEELAAIESYKDKIPLFQSSNLSIGVNLLQLLVKKAASALEGFDAEIIERHHNQKKDAPSGTALMLARSVEEGAKEQNQRIYGRHGVGQSRKRGEIGIHAVRGGSIVGEHEVMFAGEDEIVTLSHSARSRRVFASGALRAAAWLVHQPAGLYNMDDLLKNI